MFYHLFKSCSSDVSSGGCESDGANLVICGGDYVTQVVMMIVVVKKREY